MLLVPNMEEGATTFPSVAYEIPTLAHFSTSLVNSRNVIFLYLETTRSLLGLRRIN